MNLDEAKAVCGIGEQLVSLQNVYHLRWLSDQVEEQKGREWLTQSKGIPLGYDYVLANK